LGHCLSVIALNGKKKNDFGVKMTEVQNTLHGQLGGDIICFAGLLR
jgi:hypothetical protein